MVYRDQVPFHREAEDMFDHVHFLDDRSGRDLSRSLRDVLLHIAAPNLCELNFAKEWAPGGVAMMPSSRW